MMRSVLVMLRDLPADRSIGLWVWSSVEILRGAIRTGSSYAVETQVMARVCNREQTSKGRESQGTPARKGC